MSRAKQWRLQADGYLQQIVHLLRAHQDLGTCIAQEPYKSDFFEIFWDAYRSRYCSPGYRFDQGTRRYVQCKAQRPLVTGDALWSFALGLGWVRADMDATDERYQNIQTVRTWWDEWRYAGARLGR